jgi:hypothetical protein
MWTIVERNVFYKRTFRFDKTKMDQIRSTCSYKNVCSLNNGRWQSNDPKSRKNHVHTLDLARAGEIAVYTLLSKTLDPKWTVEEPNFGRRQGGQYDQGDICIHNSTETLWVEVKTTTNRRGAHTKRNVNRVAMENGYTFQKLIWNKWKQKMVLTPTFNKNSPYHGKANKRLLVGCIGTYTDDGGCSITVSKGTFLMPVGQCMWKRLNHFAEGEGDLKMVHHDINCI